MNNKGINKKSYLILGLGSLTFILFAAHLQILNLIEPAPELGQIIGENAKKMMDAINGEELTNESSNRSWWSSVLTILAFVSLSLTVVLASTSLSVQQTKWPSWIALLMSIVGVILYFVQLAIGIYVFIIIAVITVVVVLFLNA